MIKAKERIIGFWSPEEKKDRYYHASTEDLINYGFIPEFIGRTNKLFFNKLTDNDIIAILTKSKISPLILKQQLYKDIYGVDLKYDQSYLNEIIKITKQLDTGARSIKETVFNSLIKVSHELQLKKNQNIYKSVIISGETVKDNKIYQLKR